MYMYVDIQSVGCMLHIYVATVEPPIKDTPKKNTSPYLIVPIPTIPVHFYLQIKETSV